MIVVYIDEYRDRFAGRPDLHRAPRARHQNRRVHLLRRQETLHHHSGCRRGGVRREHRAPALCGQQAALRDAENVACDETRWSRRRPRSGRPADDDLRRRRCGPRTAANGDHLRYDRAPRHPDLIDRQWNAPTRLDHLWVADFTYCWALAGFVYTSFVVDVFSRRILGWRVMTTKATPLVSGVLEQALFTRRRSDLAFTEALIESGLAGSIGSVGDALDNALMESTIGLYKTELVDRQKSWTGRAEIERETASWVHWFNTGRLHYSIGYPSPVDYENKYRQNRSTATSDREVV